MRAGRHSVFEQAQHVAGEGEPGGRAVRRHAQSLHKADAVGGYALPPPICAQTLRPFQQGGLLQVEEQAVAREGRPGTDKIENIKATGETAAAFAAAEGEGRDQPLPRREKADPQIRLSKTPHMQHQGGIGPFHAKIPPRRADSARSPAAVRAAGELIGGRKRNGFYLSRLAGAGHIPPVVLES